MIRTKERTKFYNFPSPFFDRTLVSNLPGFCTRFIFGIQTRKIKDFEQIAKSLWICFLTCEVIMIYSSLPVKCFNVYFYSADNSKNYNILEIKCLEIFTLMVKQSYTLLFENTEILCLSRNINPEKTGCLKHWFSL